MIFFPIVVYNSPFYINKKLYNLYQLKLHETYKFEIFLLVKCRKIKVLKRDFVGARGCL